MRYATIPLLLTVLAAGCVTEGFDTAALPTRNRLSTQDEVKIGQQMAVQVEQQMPKLNDATVQGYVAEIGQRLAAQAPRKDVPYQFTVIQEPKEVNAFALPGGHLYVFTGLMRLASNEAELAGVMAHEIAHVAAYHHGEMLTRQYTANQLATVLLGQNPGVGAQILAQIAGQGVFAKFSRDNEVEADRMAMDMMYRAGYNPTAMITFMQKMIQLDQQQGGGGRLFALFASHPATPERMARLQALLAQYPQQTIAQMGVFPERYQQFVLARLPK